MSKLVAVDELKEAVILQSLQDENDMLRARLVQLEASQKKLPTLRVSAEENICMEQIHILKINSSNRELSLDEVKRLDLLVKNLRLIREQSTQVINTGDLGDIEEAALVAIASSSSDR